MATKEPTMARESGVSPINSVGNATSTARQQAASRAEANREVTWDSLNAKIREVARKGIRGDYGAYDAPIIEGDLERAKARITGDYYYQEAKRLQAEVKKQPKVDENKIPILQARARQRVRRQFNEARDMWNRIRKSDDYKNGRKSITRLKKYGFTDKEIRFYAS